MLVLNGLLLVVLAVSEPVGAAPVTVFELELASEEVARLVAAAVPVMVAVDAEEPDVESVCDQASAMRLESQRNSIATLCDSMMSRYTKVKARRAMFARLQDKWLTQRS